MRLELLRVDRLVHQSWGLLAAIGLVAAAVWAVLRLRPEGLLLAAVSPPFTSTTTRNGLSCWRFSRSQPWPLHGRLRHRLGPA